MNTMRNTMCAHFRKTPLGSILAAAAFLFLGGMLLFTF